MTNICNRKSIVAFCFSLALLTFISCDKSIFYEHNEKVDSQGWEMSDKLSFQLNITNLSKQYDFALNIRNTTDYPYSNVFFFITTTFPDGRFAKDTLECTLAMPDGQWTGKGSGRIKDNRFYFKKNVTFPQQGYYKFEVEQAMREEKIVGLSDIGLCISYSKTNF